MHDEAQGKHSPFCGQCWLLFNSTSVLGSLTMDKRPVPWGELPFAPQRALTISVIGLLLTEKSWHLNWVTHTSLNVPPLPLPLSSQSLGGHHLMAHRFLGIQPTGGGSSYLVLSSSFQMHPAWKPFEEFPAQMHSSFPPNPLQNTSGHWRQYLAMHGRPLLFLSF